MVISTPNLSQSDKGLALTPMMIRGAFLLWRSELQRGQQYAEIRDFDLSTPSSQLSSGASGNFSSLNWDHPDRHSTIR